jgi:periplasmic divalent cation tolerance protein
MPETVILYTTWPDAEKAEAVGAEAVAERLAACANVFSPIISIYRWEGAIERCNEVPMTLKTSARAAPALRDFLRSRHPYEVPCILTLRADPALSDAAYLEWVDGQT